MKIINLSNFLCGHAIAQLCGNLCSICCKWHPGLNQIKFEKCFKLLFNILNKLEVGNIIRKDTLRIQMLSKNLTISGLSSKKRLKFWTLDKVGTNNWYFFYYLIILVLVFLSNSSYLYNY